MKMNRRGQGMVEYIIIVAVVALAALALFGLFGDTIKEKLHGAVGALGGTAPAPTTTSEDYLKALK